MVLTLSNPISLPSTLFIFIHFMASSDFLLFNSFWMASLINVEALNPSFSMSFLTFSGTRTAMTTVFFNVFTSYYFFVYKNINISVMLNILYSCHLTAFVNKLRLS